MGIDECFILRKMWLEDERCEEMVEQGWNQVNNLLSFDERVKNCASHLSMWDQKTFSNNGRRIKNIKARLEKL